jgi:hypothetical protein
MKKPSKIYVKYSEGEYDNNPFIGSAYSAKREDMTKENSGEYLAKNAILQGLLVLYREAKKPATRADGNSLTRKYASERLKMLDGIIQQIAKM